MDDIMQPPTDEQLQEQVEALPNPAPRLTPELISAVIASEGYTRLEGTNITICTLTLQNGHRVVGKNMGPVSDANYDQEVGCQYAFKDAYEQIWALEGYLLRERIYQEQEGGENLKNAATQVFHVLRQVQAAIRDRGENDLAEEVLERITALLVDPLSVQVA
jgi:hypothetical protein